MVVLNEAVHGLRLRSVAPAPALVLPLQAAPTAPSHLAGWILSAASQVYNKVETKSFPAAANPCIKGKASRKLI